jgi:cyclophilin family peptidyl-prolyl cis-trans isomerase
VPDRVPSLPGRQLRGTALKSPEHPAAATVGAGTPAHSEANAGPNTNGSQFFIVYDDSQLPPEYTVFGTVDDAGLAIVDKIAKAGIVGGGDDGVPVTTATITSVRLD